jgi:endo-1,4-beta-xylanase
MKHSDRVGSLPIVLTGALLFCACASQPSTSAHAAAVGGGGGGAVVGTSGSGANAAGPSGAAATGAAATGGLSGSDRGGASGGAQIGTISAGAAATAGRAGSVAGMGGMSAVAGSGTGGASGTGPTGGMAGAAPTAGAGGSAGSTAGAGSVVPGKKFCGNITTGGKVRSDFAQYWDQITPENEGKWGSVESVRDQMNWSGLDAAYNYAKQHNIVFKQHNFVWGSQQPSWLNGLSQDQQRAQVEEWIRLYCERYPDTQLIDVVNEPPPHTTPVYTAALGGAGASGYDWIVQAFKWAHQYCPNAILILNDYNNIEYANDNSHFIDIVNRIKAAGAPIHAIGAQAHDAYKQPTATVQMYIDKLASSTGLPVYISEYDINQADDNQQKSVMQSQFTMFWNDDHVKGITIWGYIEGQTWETNTGLMSSSGQKRPAMTWLLDFLHR